MMSSSFKELDLTEKDQEECSEYAMMMKDFIQCGVDALSPYGPLLDRRSPDWTKFGVRIEYKHPEVPVPFYGFLDFLYDDVVVDLKVLGKKPSKLSMAYVQQGLIYKWGTGLPVVFEAISHTKTRGCECNRHKLSDQPYLSWHEKYLVAAANNLLAVYDAINNGDTVTLLRLMSFPNLDAVWNQKESESLFEEFVTNAKFLVEDEASGDDYQTVDPSQEKEKKAASGNPFANDNSCPL